MTGLGLSVSGGGGGGSECKDSSRYGGFPKLGVPFFGGFP